MACEVTDDCVSFVIQHFQDKEFGSVNYLAGEYLDKNGIERPYGKLSGFEPSIRKPIMSCKHVISMTMRNLERQGFLKQFSRTSWGKIAPVPIDAVVDIKVKLSKVINIKKFF